MSPDMPKGCLPRSRVTGDNRGLTATGWFPNRADVVYTRIQKGPGGHGPGDAAAGPEGAGAQPAAAGFAANSLKMQEE